MSFDAHSLQRLQELGRRLPEPLAAPEPSPRPSGKASGQLHPVETETDPQALFRELMHVSPDGSVPPHLLERLRETEAQQARQQLEQRRQALHQAAAGGGTPAEQARRRTGQGRDSGGVLRPNPGRRQPATGDELQLYSAFQQALLEGEDDEPGGPMPK